MVSQYLDYTLFSEVSQIEWIMSCLDEVKVTKCF